MEQKQIQIHKDMAIAEVLASFPEKARLLSEILIDFGIHCVGCGAATFETLEEGVLGHGFSEEQLNQLVIDLNKAVSGSHEGTKINLTQAKIPENFKVNITKSAIEKIKEIMTKEGKENELLRVSVLAGGCSGYTYDLEILPESQKSDIKFKQDGLEIAIDRESTEFLNGAEIDFIDTLKESGFKFNNPNASKECGCGKSFS